MLILQVNCYIYLTIKIFRGIPLPLRSALNEMRYTEPSRIQAVAIPIIMQGKNLIAQAETGSGKTLAFIVGMFSQIDIFFSVLPYL